MTARLPNAHTPAGGHGPMQHLQKLVDHLVWADARVLEGLRTSPGSDPRTIELYAHVLGAEHVWLARIAGRQPSVA
ncbi:MAG TPA: hypothetical protein VNB89_02350, partial [Gemmatimonadaceae bacterium]|nr:hypothetical protein [Gemmatimonadaceae bacterium]